MNDTNQNYRFAFSQSTTDGRDDQRNYSEVHFNTKRGRARKLDGIEKETFGRNRINIAIANDIHSKKRSPHLYNPKEEGLGGYDMHYINAYSKNKKDQKCQSLSNIIERKAA